MLTGIRVHKKTAAPTHKDDKGRQLVLRAKNVLMSTQAMDEAQAHRFLQLQSMNRRKSLYEIAEAIVLSSSLLNNSNS